MNPAFSVVVFTAISGMAQGLVVGLAVAVLAGVSIGAAFLGAALLAAVAMLLVGLGASFLHLGRPARAWRAVMMWRTSWLSREVIVLPAFIGLVGAWWLALRLGAPPLWHATLLPLACIGIAALLWYCTAMIYACLRFIEEWAHPLTLVNFVLIGLSTGFVLCGALSRQAGADELLHAVAPWALAATLAAAATRLLAFRRNAALHPRSTLQSATGIRAPHLVQKSMGMSAGSFNTREFFHGASVAALRQVKWAAIGLLFGVPIACLVWGLAAGTAVPWGLAVASQAIGLLADRWTFFAEARHPQNLYYQVVS